ncbi:HHIP-like protein 2, partial [Limulus polyphemus]|uniref:HHIP-like protein 2 n=1 Tax=Limulus polyphemus TaxID=6850 RepID=A0ABM1TS23_LIMPO
VDKSSEEVILEIEQPGPRQNGGQLFFGNDGYLYITTGDGGDRANSRFDKFSLLGKILRINASLASPYGVPESNPFVNSGRPEVFAYGFRNPWRCAVDQATYQNRIICGDVGEEDRNEEEISVIVAGGRYGWIDTEHAPCRSLKECKKVENLLSDEDQLPIHVYSLPKGQAVVGGVVYRGTNIRSLQGLYVYGDFVHGSLHYLKEETF